MFEKLDDNLIAFVVRTDLPRCIYASIATKARDVDSLQLN